MHSGKLKIIRRKCSVLFLVLILLSSIIFSPLFTVEVSAKKEAKIAVTEDGKNVLIPDSWEDEEFLHATKENIANLTDEQKLADYDTLWEILEESYPMLDYLARFGSNVEEIKERYRNDVIYLQTNEDWIYYFSQMLNELMQEQYNAGHLSVVPTDDELIFQEYQNYAYSKKYYPDDKWVARVEDVFDNPHVVGLYDLFIEEKEDDKELPMIDIEDNLYTELHPEEGWAYISVYSFLNQNPEDDEIIRNFLVDAEEAGIEHIVIDVRKNSGGYNDYWLRNFISPNLRKAKKVVNYGLYKNSPWNRKSLDFFVNQGPANFYTSEVEAYKYMPTIVIDWERSKKKLPEMEKINKQDVENLPKVFKETIKVIPSREEPVFNGKFWILSSPYSYSASEYFISFAKRTDFATIVGEVSGGDGSCVVTLYNALPESGLVLCYNAIYGMNADGTPSEETGTMPDYLINEGEDALDKALELIFEEKSK